MNSAKSPAFKGLGLSTLSCVDKSIKLLKLRKININLRTILFNHSIIGLKVSSLILTKLIITIEK